MLSHPCDVLVSSQKFSYKAKTRKGRMYKFLKVDLWELGEETDYGMEIRPDFKVCKRKVCGLWRKI